MTRLITETYRLKQENRQFFHNELSYKLGIIGDIIPKALRPHSFMQILKSFLHAISSKDPTPFHFETSREVLKEIDVNSLGNNDVVYLLAKQLKEKGESISKAIKYPERFETFRNDCLNTSPGKNILDDFVIITCVEADEFLDKQFFNEKSHLALWDHAYIELLKKIGPSGRKTADELEAKIKSKKNGWDQSLWFSQSQEAGKPFHSRALTILAKVLWEDTVKKKAKFFSDNVPALPTVVHKPVVQMLTSRNSIEATEHSIDVYHHGSRLGFVPISEMQQSIIEIVTRGIYRLGSVLAHKLIRFLIALSYNNIIHSDPDFRVIKLHRGTTEIAETLGVKSNKAISHIKEIIHALAFFYFPDPAIKGNLIQLTLYKSPLTKREDEGYSITVGASLVPYRACEAHRKGENILLIPLLQDPPLINPKNYHSQQYLLQMQVMGEFSKKSIQLFKENAVQITWETWEELAQSCCLPQSMLPRVIDRWTQDGNDGAKFLELIEGDFFTLGNEHGKALAFLKDQGKLRTQQSSRGKAGAIKKERAKKR